MNTRQFIDGLAEPNIFTIDELAKMRRQLSPEQLEAPADALARELVHRRKLTRFQATQILQGRGRALTFGDYLVLDKLGEGGMGQVYKAEHRRMKRIVALKVLPPEATKSKGSVERFYKEVELAARLSHPNIVAAFDAGESRGLHYLVMEYVDGYDLSSHIKANGPLSVEQAMNCTLQAAKGLEYAHGEGIIHRDVKPSNLIVNQRGDVKLLDMGLARLEHSFAAPVAAGRAELTTSGQVLGTVDYMAPEQCYDSRTADNRSDIYSLGCTLYRLLTGNPPYEAETMMQKLLAHREQPIPSLRDVRDDVSPRLEALFQRMVAKSPDDRPQSMREVIGALEALLAGVSSDESIVTSIESPESDEGLDSFLQRMASSSSIGSSASGRSKSDTHPPGSSATLAGEPRSHSSSGGRIALNSPLVLWGSVTAAVALIFVVLALLLPKSKPEPSKEQNQRDKKEQVVADVNPAEQSETQPKKRRLVDEIPKTVVDDSIAQKPKTPPQTPKPPPAPPKTSTPKAPSSKDDWFDALLASKPPASRPAPPSTTPTNAAKPPAPSAPAMSKIDKLTAPIDLLKQIAGPVSGKHVLDAKGLSGDGTLRFAVVPPDEYDLIVVIDDLKLEGECDFGLPVQGQATTVSLVRTNKAEWWMTFNQPNWPSQRGMTLPNGPLTIVCSVRKGRVHVSFEGETALDWFERPEGPGLQSKLVDAGQQLALRIKSKFHITRLELQPPGTRLPAYGVTNVLARATTTSGIVQPDRTGLTLATTNDRAGSSAALSAERPSEYVLTAVVERLSGIDSLQFGLPIGRSRAVASLDQSNGTSEILSLNNKVKPPERMLLTPWRLHTVVCRVFGGNLAEIVVEVDGRGILHHQGPLDRIGFAAGANDPGAFFARAAGSSAFRIHHCDIIPLDWQKLAEPSASDLESAGKTLESTISSLKDQHDRAEGAPTVAEKLWQQVARAGGDPARQWVLLDAAAQQAATEGDLALTCRVALEMARTFDADLDAWFGKLFANIFKSAKTSAARQALAAETQRQIEIAVALEEFGLASALVSAAAPLKSLPAEFLKEFKIRGTELAFWRGQQAAGQKALAALPLGESTESHRDAAMYLAVVRHDWPAAAQHFTKCGETQWAELAANEAQADQAADPVAIGDRWWSVSTKAEAPVKWWCMERAAHWYTLSGPNLSGKAKALEGKAKSLARLRKTSGDAFRPRHPSDAVPIGGRWYKLYSSPANWKTAAEVCRSWGATLPIVKTLDDNQAVIQVLMSASTSNERRYTWLACADQATEGDFRWLDGSAVAAGFSNWRKNEPDNGGGNQDFGLMLVMFEKGQVKSDWSDESETASFPFICVWND